MPHSQYDDAPGGGDYDAYRNVGVAPIKGVDRANSRARGSSRTRARGANDSHERSNDNEIKADDSTPSTRCPCHEQDGNRQKGSPAKQLGV